MGLKQWQKDAIQKATSHMTVTVDKDGTVKGSIDGNLHVVASALAGLCEQHGGFKAVVQAVANHIGQNDNAESVNDNGAGVNDNG